MELQGWLDLLWRDGDGPYVWLAYGLGLLALAVEWRLLRQRHRRAAALASSGADGQPTPRRMPGGAGR